MKEFDFMSMAAYEACECDAIKVNGNVVELDSYSTGFSYKYDVTVWHGDAHASATSWQETEDDSAYYTFLEAYEACCKELGIEPKYS